MEKTVEDDSSADEHLLFMTSVHSSFKENIGENTENVERKYQRVVMNSISVNNDCHYFTFCIMQNRSENTQLRKNKKKLGITQEMLIDSFFVFHHSLPLSFFNVNNFRSNLYL